MIAHWIFEIECLIAIKRKYLSCSSQVTLFRCISLYWHSGTFTLSHIISLNLPTRSLSITGHWNVSLPSGASPWNSIFWGPGRRSKHNNLDNAGVWIFLESLYQSIGNSTECPSYNWYHCYILVLLLLLLFLLLLKYRKQHATMVSEQNLYRSIKMTM